MNQTKIILKILRLRIEANEKDAIAENNKLFCGKSEFNRGWACAMATASKFIENLEEEIIK